MKLALFDFDGTISHRDSMFHFIRFARGEFSFLLGLFICSPVLLSYFAKFLSNQRAKEILYHYYFKNWEFEKFQALCEDYAQHGLPLIIRSDALKKIHWHKDQGHRIIIVSASIENYLRPWCQTLQLELLATQLQFTKLNKQPALFSGHFNSANCTGIEKAKRIQALLDLTDYEFIYAYGDSTGDKEMLALAHERHFKPFR
jgi:phosphatidylglycerophosphatase C